MRKRSMGHCGVPQCNSYKSPSISMHRIPKRIVDIPTELIKWKIALKMGKEFPKNFVVCSRHFKSKYLLTPIHSTKPKVFLAKSAFPTENLPQAYVQPKKIQQTTTVRSKKRGSRSIAKSAKIGKGIRYQKVLLEETPESDSLTPPIQIDEPKTPFEYVEIKQEPDDDSFSEIEVQAPLDSPISHSSVNFPVPFIDIKTEPKDDSPPPSPITQNKPLRRLKRKLILKRLIPPENYIKQRSKPVMVDQACQTDDYNDKDDKDKLIALLKRQNEQLKECLAIKPTHNQFGKIPLESLKGQNKKVRYLTGFPTFVTMEIIYKDVANYIPFAGGGKMSKFDVFFTTWMKLKLDLSLNYLSIMMNISLPTITRLFYETFVILYGRLSGYIVWPDDTDIRENTPANYKQIFGDRRCVIVDCFEVFSARDTNNLSTIPARNKLAQERLIQPNKEKSHNQPLKYLMCFSADGTIIYVSKPFEIQLSKRCIAKRSGFLDMIEANDIILGDQEFVYDSVYKTQEKYKNIVPMVKNLDGELIEMEFEATEEFTKIRENITTMLQCTIRRIMMLTNRPPILAVTNKYGEEMYLDFVIKMACSVLNLTTSQVDMAEEMDDLDTEK